MQCEKCGYKNSEYSIICENCGSPLNIEKNIELQKKYHNKQRAIDIDEINIPEDKEQEFNDTKVKIKRALFVGILIFLAVLILGLSVIIKNFQSRDILNQYKKFISNNDVGVLYLGNDDKANNLIIDYASLYDFNYLYVDTNDITALKRNHIKHDLKISSINSTVVIVKNNQTIDWLNDYDADKQDVLLTFLQKNSIIPLKLGDPKQIISEFETAIKAKDPTIIYYVNNDLKKYLNNDEKFRSFCKDYSINYTFIESYYLTDKQKLSLLRKANYNELQEELLIIVDEEKIINIMEKVDFNSNDYFEIMSNYGIIDESSANSLKQISFDELTNIILEQDKNIIMFGSSDCPYCDRISPIIGKIGIQNNIDIYYYNIDNDTRVDSYLTSIGYQEGKVVPPVIIITENNSTLGYVVGLADKNLLETKLKELGAIR